jgi:glycosyltransferase involved in cell wall biosynthesis
MGISLNETEQMDRQRDLLTTRVDSIKKDDFVIVWTGGIWDWFDAKTPIDAVNSLIKSGKKNVKFVFLGTKHPNDDVPAMAETEIAREHATKLGLINKIVFFLDGWLPYSDRIYYLNRADLALYAHKPSIESRFSHRTRVLDHILMELPTIATKGDYFSDYIDEHKLGISVEPFDSDAMASAILKLADDKSLQEDIVKNIKASQPYFTWDYTLDPLNEYINSEHFHSSSYSKRVTLTTSESVVSSRPITTVRKMIPKKVKKVIKRILR